jgi:hypothetical protein
MTGSWVQPGQSELCSSWFVFAMMTTCHSSVELKPPHPKAAVLQQPGVAVEVMTRLQLR